MTTHPTPRTAAARLASAATATAALIATPAAAGGLEVEITLPEIAAAPYYRPYLAAWIEDAAAKEIRGTVAVWYDTRLRDNIGAGFLRSLRTWWRSAGEAMTLPADGISGPTHGPGSHALTIPGDSGVLAALAPGDYVLVAEVAREDGGREVLRAPFAWGGAANTGEAEGDTEITRLRVSVAP